MKQVGNFCVTVLVLFSVISAAAQTTAYHQTNLVSNLPATAVHTDIRFINPWGLAFIPGQPFFIADNPQGVVRVYDGAGNHQFPGVFGVIPAAGSSAPATPSGIIRNPFTQFGDFTLAGTASQFLVATQDGTISGWASVDGATPAFATQAIDNSSAGAAYTGLAILAPQCCLEFLAVANFHSGFIEPYTVFFDRLAPPGSFTDPELPAGYAPFNIQKIGTRVFVTYALQDSKKHDPVPGPGNGLVDIFDHEGNFVKRFVSHGPLNAPWAVVKASAHFGMFSNAILIGNFGDGTVTAFDSTTGRFLGRLKNAAGKVITNSGLRGLTFGAGGTGSTNILYFTAGVKQGQGGLFGAISVSLP